MLSRLEFFDMSSTFGTVFKVTTFGESHGAGVGVVVDGCPAGIELSEVDLQPQLSRRRPGQSDLTTRRDEKDEIQIYSGVDGGITLGTPIAMMVLNQDQRPADYDEMANVPRPSHADYTYRAKYGVSAASGGGRASARETIGRVAAGALAEKVLSREHGVEIVAWVSAIGSIEIEPPPEGTVGRAQVDANDVRCPDSAIAEKMIEAIQAIRKEGDSLGGIITCECRGVPAGLGEPVFDKLEAMLAGAMLSLPATKGFEIGSGFEGTRSTGSAHNDVFVKNARGLGTATNRSGGIQGGISNGEPIVFRVAFKPPSTIAQEQETADYDGNTVAFRGRGRHDPCVLPRAVPIVESMAALVLVDMALRQAARRSPPE